ncbi:MAG: hypothetical protein HFH76_12225 [Lachnospiraceae bacterium]|nr:hypothetical protein [Lachnospiraceae bacterium]
MQKSIDYLLEDLDEGDYDKVVSYIEFLVDAKKKKRKEERAAEEQVDVDMIVASLVGAIPDTGKTLEDYKEAEMKVWDPEEIVSWWN